MSLTIENLQDKININENLLTVKELLKIIKYDVNELYIDKFWENIKNNKWLYIDNNMIEYIGYSDINSGKKTYIKLLNNNFKEDIDFKYINNKEFTTISMEHLCSIENIDINTHNKVKHIIISPKCFKKSLMMLRTIKSEDIRNYYIELEEIFNFYLQYQNKYQELKYSKELEQSKLELEEKNSIINNAKLNHHNYLIEKFNCKRVVYVVEIKEDVLIKVGSSNDIKKRMISLSSFHHCKCILLDIFECENFRQIESNILTNSIFKKNIYNCKINDILSREIVQLNNNFNYSQLLKIIKDNINESIFLNPVQLLEKQKLDMENKKIELINRLLENGYNPNLFNDIKITIICDNSNNINIDDINNTDINNNDADDNSNINNNDADDNSNNDNTDVDDDSNNDNTDIDNNSNNDNTDIDNNSNNCNLFEPNIEVNNKFKFKKPRGRKIQKIDPNNLDNIINIYDSMYYLLRCNEGIKYCKSNVQDAIRNNSLYKGYRWDFVEKGDDPFISKAKPTNPLVTARIVEPIVKMDISKTKIIDIYDSQELCYLNNGISKDKMRHLIKTHIPFHSFYFIKVSDCPSNILEKFNIIQSDFKKNSILNKPIIQINPLTKEEFIFDTITEIPIKIGGSESSINSAIRNNTIYNGYYWKLSK